MREVRIPAYAKINMRLEILGKRADGYHELRTIFQTVSLHDRLTFRPGRGAGISLVIRGNEALSQEAAEKNLVYRAADALRRELKIRSGVEIELQKKIPAGRGLGGGSSDAAATLRGLQWLFEAPISDEKMNAMAAQLGSDVNFFLTGGTALGTGRGEMITPWKGRDFAIPVVLIKPPLGLSTPAVYQSGKAVFTSGERAKGFQSVWAGDSPASIAGHLFNGLEPAAFYLRPEVERIKKRLMGEGALGALLSGSGPTVFALASDGEKARAIASKFEDEGLEVVVTQTVATGVQKLKD